MTPTSDFPFETEVETEGDSHTSDYTPTESATSDTTGNLTTVNTTEETSTGSGESDDPLGIPAIIGIAAAAAVVVILIVVCCVCCRKRSTPSRRGSNQMRRKSTKKWTQYWSNFTFRHKSKENGNCPPSKEDLHGTGRNTNQTVEHKPPISNTYAVEPNLQTAPSPKPSSTGRDVRTDSFTDAKEQIHGTIEDVEKAREPKNTTVHFHCAADPDKGIGERNSRVQSTYTVPEERQLQPSKGADNAGYLTMECETKKQNITKENTKDPGYLTMDSMDSEVPQQNVTAEQITDSSILADANKPGYENIKQLSDSANKKDYVNVDSWTANGGLELQEMDKPKYVNHKDSSLPRPNPQDPTQEEDTEYYNEPTMHYYNSNMHLPTSNLRLNQI